MRVIKQTADCTAVEMSAADFVVALEASVAVFASGEEWQQQRRRQRRKYPTK